MTRATKLAVMLWGVTALSGCVPLRTSDKPNTPKPAAKHITIMKPEPKPFDKTSVAYTRGVDSLRKLTQEKALVLLRTPLKNNTPVALPPSAYEKHKLDSMKIKDINLNDTCYTQRQEIYMPSLTSRPHILPIVDFDEILQQVGSADYIKYANMSLQERVLSVRDMRSMLKEYRNVTGHPEAKLFLSLIPEVNAFNMSESAKIRQGMRPDLPTARICTGSLESQNIDYICSTMRHEGGHEVLVDMNEDFFISYATVLSDEFHTLYDMSYIYAFSRYHEAGADSVGFAHSNKNGAYLGKAPETIPDIARLIDYYQKERASIATVAARIAMRDTPTAKPVESERLSGALSHLVTSASFTPSPTATHPTHAQRIFYLLVHQKRAEELAENGKTMLYEQYGELLPQRPSAIPAFKTLEIKGFQKIEFR